MKLEPHPMAGASLVEVMDYLALRLAEMRDANVDDRNLRNASDRYDEAYMWVVAWVSSQADVAAPAVDAVPAGEVGKMVETLRGEMAAEPKRDWYPVHRDYLDAILTAALSHGEGR